MANGECRLRTAFLHVCVCVCTLLVLACACPAMCMYVNLEYTCRCVCVLLCVCARAWVLRYVLVSKETYNRPKETYIYGNRGLSAIAYLRYANVSKATYLYGKRRLLRGAYVKCVRGGAASQKYADVLRESGVSGDGDLLRSKRGLSIHLRI